ncbi:hypothetical protein [Haloglomus salinum]|uniref:hypothetical protein n=1 Tax=Haloglomus salinum TaxID=2962673 RepID=UPI0020C99D10|nr:hypothetical protein [Haloglomus salinum]
MVTLETTSGSEFEFEYVVVKENGMHMGFDAESDKAPEKVFPEGNVLSLTPEKGVDRFVDTFGEKVKNTHDGSLYASECVIEYRIQ